MRIRGKSGLLSGCRESKRLAIVLPTLDNLHVMYCPSTFAVTDPSVLHAFIRRHSFATLVTHDGHVPQATHLPVLLRENSPSQVTLVTHVARANPQWKHLENGREVLVMFAGPHAYVSPAWYATEPAVPTWNYTAVHVYGVPRLVSDPAELSAMLDELIEFYESRRPNRWHGNLPVDYRQKMMKAIVGIEIAIRRIEGKFKLSQNRPDDVRGVIAALSGSENPTDRETARMMSAADEL